MTEPVIASVFADSRANGWVARVEYLDDEIWFGREGRGQTKVEAFEDLFRRLAADPAITVLAEKAGTA